MAVAIVGLKSDRTTGHLEVDTPRSTVPSLSTSSRLIIYHSSVHFKKKVAYAKYTSIRYKFTNTHRMNQY